MKLKFLSFLFFVSIFFNFYAQSNINPDSIKNEIIKETDNIIDLSFSKIEFRLNQISDSLRNEAKINAEQLSNEAIHDLINSVKTEIIDETNELIENRIAKLIAEFSEMIKQSNNELYNEVNQLIVETRTSLNEESQNLINKAEDKGVLRANEIIEKNNSEIMLTIEEKIEYENAALLQRIDDQNKLIYELQRRIEELEKNIK